MKKFTIIAAISFTLASCGGGEAKQESKSSSDNNPRFDKYKEQFILNLWKTYPGWASSQGYHLYDSVLVIPNEAGRTAELNFAKANLDSLQTVDINGLSDNNKTDYHIIDCN